MDKPVGSSDPQASAGPEAAAAGDFVSQTQMAGHLRAIQNKLELLMAQLNSETAADDSRDTVGPEPEVDIYENDLEFLVHAELPGAPPDRIRIDATAHSITINAEIAPRRQDKSHDGGGSKRHRKSRHSDGARYHFVYTLQTPIAPERARAEYRHGVLEIYLPKAHPSPISFQVPIGLSDGISPVVTLPHAAVPVGSEVLVISTHEGSPRHKLGAAYSPSAGEDHTAKAQSVGDRYAPGRETQPPVPRRTER